MHLRVVVNEHAVVERGDVDVGRVGHVEDPEQREPRTHDQICGVRCGYCWPLPFVLAGLSSIATSRARPRMATCLPHRRGERQDPTIATYSQCRAAGYGPFGPG